MKIWRALPLLFLLLVMAPLSANAHDMEAARFKRTLTFLDKPSYFGV